MSDAKQNPHPSDGIAHDWGCTHNPCKCDGRTAMTKQLYRIDLEQAADLDMSTDFDGMPDPLRSLIADSVLVPAKPTDACPQCVPCEHGKPCEACLGSGFVEGTSVPFVECWACTGQGGQR